jgi:hypothetical protein
MVSTFDAVRAEALFTSSIQVSQQPVAEEVREAVAVTLRRFGVRGCAANVAGEFGEHPETAAGRMCWALAMIKLAYGDPDPACGGPPHGAPTAA